MMTGVFAAEFSDIVALNISDWNWGGISFTSMMFTVTVATLDFFSTVCISLAMTYGNRKYVNDIHFISSYKHDKNVRLSSYCSF